MARSDYVARVKAILYGQGVGEAPPIRRCAADANEVVSGSTVTFDLLTDEGQYVNAGDVLSAISDTESTSYAMYVLSVSTDSVTAVNGHLGTTAVADTNLDGVLLEVNPPWPGAEIHRAIDTIFERMLYPQCFKLVTATITPDLSTGEVELDALDQKVLSAHQVIGGQTYPIPVGIQRNLHSSVSSTGVLGYFDFADGSTTYITTERKLTLGDEDASTPIDIVRLVATGAAALLLGASVSETDLERSKKDSQQRRPDSVAQVLWRDFLTLKQQFAEETSRDTVTQFIVYRG